MRIFAAIGLLCAILRLSECMALNKRGGVLLVCFGRLLTELSLWLQPAFLLTIAFAIGFAILTPSYQLSGTRGPITPFPQLALDFSVGGPLWAPLWALFGYIEPFELDRSPTAYETSDGSSFGGSTTASILAPLWLWLYLLCMLAFLVNVLIALLVKAHNGIAEEAEAHWQLAKLLHLRRYALLNPCPPPLNLIGIPFAAFFPWAAQKLIDIPIINKCVRKLNPILHCCYPDVPPPKTKASSKIAAAPYPDGKAKGKALLGAYPDRWMVIPAGPQEPQMADPTLYSYHMCEAVEGKARASLLRRLSREARTTANATHADALKMVERRVCELQDEITHERALLNKTLADMRTKKLLDVLPAFSKEAVKDAAKASGGGISKLQHDVHLGFAEALTEAIAPMLIKVETVEATVKDLQKKAAHAALGPAPVPTGVGGIKQEKADAYREGRPASADGRSSYLQQAHPMGHAAYRMPLAENAPLPVPHRAPPTPPKQFSAPALPPIGKQLPPPKASDAGPDPYPYHISSTFKKFDKDHSGTIDVGELRAALQHMGLKTNTAEAAQLMAQYDADKSGQIDMAEWATLVEELQRFHKAARRSAEAQKGVEDGDRAHHAASHGLGCRER